MVFRLVHPLKGLSTSFKLAGILISVKEVQFLKALDHNVVKLAGKFTDANFVQPEKA